MVPILMTATVTSLALLPLALGSRQPGREIEGPMAVVILGGLISSPLLNLLPLPAIIHRFGRFAAANRQGMRAWILLGEGKTALPDPAAAFRPLTERDGGGHPAAVAGTRAELARVRTALGRKDLPAGR